jgi:hypothetical protein
MWERQFGKCCDGTQPKPDHHTAVAFPLFRSDAVSRNVNAFCLRASTQATPPHRCQVPALSPCSVGRGLSGFGCARPFSRWHYPANALNRFGRACRTPGSRLKARTGNAGAPRARACALPLVAPRARRQSRRARKTVGRCKRWAFAGQPSGFPQSLRCYRGSLPSAEPYRFSKRLGFCLPQVTTPHHHGFSLFPFDGAGGFAPLQPPTTRMNGNQKTGASPQFSEPFPHPHPTLSKMVWFASWLTPSREPNG